MENELRHCTYCRRDGRNGNISVRGHAEYDEDDARYQVLCLTCGASGPNERTKEEAEAAWNVNTAIVADAELGAQNMKALVLMTEEWKLRALASAAFADDLATLMTDLKDSLVIKSRAVVEKHRDAIANLCPEEHGPKAKKE